MHQNDKDTGNMSRFKIDGCLAFTLTAELSRGEKNPRDSGVNGECTHSIAHSYVSKGCAQLV